MSVNRVYLPYIAAFGFAGIFGLSFLFSRNVLQWVSPLQLLAFRFAIAVVFMQVLQVLGLIRVNLEKGSLKPLLLLGILQPVLYFICETVGIQLTSASEAGMMIALIPIFTIIAARFFLREIPSPAQVIAIVLSVSGVMLIGVMQATQGLGSDFWGLLILLGAPVVAAGFTVLSRYLSTRYKALEMTYVMMHVGLAVFLPLSLLQALVQGTMTDYLVPLTNYSVLIGIFYLGVFSSGIAFFLMNYALALLTAAQVSAFPSLTTLIAVGASVIFLRETLYWYQITGGILIIVGVWGANHFQLKRAQLAPPIAPKIE